LCSFVLEKHIWHQRSRKRTRKRAENKWNSLKRRTSEGTYSTRYRPMCQTFLFRRRSDSENSSRLLLSTRRAICETGISWCNLSHKGCCKSGTRPLESNPGPNWKINCYQC
jgi:hypothetical protein